MGALRARGSAAARTAFHSPASAPRRQRASVPCRERPAASAVRRSSWTFLSRMQVRSFGRTASPAPTASKRPVTKPMWLISSTKSRSVRARLRRARDTTWAAAAPSTAPMHSRPIWLISRKVWLSWLGR